MSSTVIGLDVGERRIGVARADSQVKLATPYMIVSVDGTEIEQIGMAVKDVCPESIVVGLPRNQFGQETEQTHKVRQFAIQLERFKLPIIFQDESVTSIEAEMRLQQRGRGYSKGDIDAEAASIILQDYMERTYGH